MSRRWFWPVILVAVLLLSLSVGFLWSTVMLYELDGVPEMPRRISDTYSETHVYWVDVSPVSYVIAGVVAATGVFMLVLAARLR